MLGPSILRMVSGRRLGLVYTFGGSKVPSTFKNNWEKQNKYYEKTEIFITSVFGQIDFIL